MADAPDTHADDGVWVDLCSLADLPETGGRYVSCEHRHLAVFRAGDNGDQVRVTNDTCPHAGGSLSSGHVSDGCVICPWHGWPFEIDTGKCPDSPTVRVRTWPARVVDGQVQMRVE